MLCLAYRSSRPTLASLQLAAKRFNATATAAVPSSDQSENIEKPTFDHQPSRVLNRLEEYYDNVLAEDLMILTYNHFHHNPESQYRKVVKEANSSLNHEYRQYLESKREELERHHLTSSTRKQLQKIQKSADKKKSADKQKLIENEDNQLEHKAFLNYLDPAPLTPLQLDGLPSAYDRIPRLRQIQIKMLMPQAVTHSKKVLYTGMLALQLVTCKHAVPVLAEESMSELKARKGMPLGVQVSLGEEGGIQDERLMYSFMEKLSEVVMPKLRDFQGFSKHHGVIVTPPSTNHGGKLTLKFDAETWQAFPEIEFAYLKFPQLGQVGALQDFEISFKITGSLCDADGVSGDKWDADYAIKLLLSGFHLPFSYQEPVAVVQDERLARLSKYYNPGEVEEEFIHDV